jgi:7-cyano-7-deazaguanine synthase
LAIFIDYGQITVDGERAAAQRICKLLDLELVEISCDASMIGSGSLRFGAAAGLRKEYWPFRNQFLLTIGAMYGETYAVDEILFGSVKEDLRFPDCTKKFFDRCNHLISLQHSGIRISAPAVEMSVIDLVKRSNMTWEIFGWCHSCNVSARSCGQCGSCVKASRVLAALDQTE